MAGAAMESALKRFHADDSYNFSVGVISMNKIGFVGIGGFAGSIFRYSIDRLTQQLTNNIVFPYGPLLTNLGGDLLLGLLSQLGETRLIFTAQLRIYLHRHIRRVHHLLNLRKRDYRFAARWRWLARSLQCRSEYRARIGRSMAGTYVRRRCSYLLRAGLISE
jgi:hypothetical protein